jgi:hypothetical protein
VAYELLFGKRPFRGKTNSSLTQAILRDTMKFPDSASGIVSAAGLDCIRGVSSSIARSIGLILTSSSSYFNEIQESD